MPAAAQSSPLREFLLVQSPGQLRLRAGSDAANGSATTGPQVDLAAGVLRGVSLITAEVPAKGWPFFVDATTVAQFAALLKGRRLKAYATHGEWGRDGTLDEVGYWENATIDGANLRADFTALDAWKKFSEADFATLFELATKLPQEFGASLAFGYQLAWVRTGGVDVPTTITGWDYDSDAPQFTPSAPADALRSDLPSVRPVSVSSADFVDDPAANEGLFRAGQTKPAVDAPAQAKPATLSTMPLSIKELHARFSSNSAHLGRALALSAANESHSLDQIANTITTEEQGAELATLRSGAQTAATEIAALKTAKTALDAAEALLSTAGFKAKDGKTALEVALAEIAALKTSVSEKDTAIASLRNGGAFRVRTGEGGENAPAPAGSGALSGRRRAGAAFNAAFAAAGITKPAPAAAK